MARKKKQRRKADNVQIYQNKFVILRDRSAGVAEIAYELRTDDGDIDDGKLSLPIISCWMDRHDGNAVKVHLKADPSRPSHAKLLNLIVSNGKLDGMNGVFTADKRGTVRFGYDPTTRNVDGYSGYCHSDYKTYTIYDSSAIAIDAILREISRRLQVGGINLINLATIADSVLEEVGFEKVPDLLRRGIPMWMGNATDILRAGGRGNWEQESENCKSFLVLLQDAIGRRDKEVA